MTWEWIPILIVVGVALIWFEIFVPGMILASAGTLCLIASVVVGFRLFGIGWGMALLAAEVAGLFVGIRKWAVWFPKTAAGRKMILQETSGAAAQVDGKESLLGQTGVTISACRPSGVAEFGGRRYDVISESAFLSPGQPVKVIAVEGVKITVRAT